jgi:hypothetical protein
MQWEPRAFTSRWVQASAEWLNVISRSFRYLVWLGSGGGQEHSHTGGRCLSPQCPMLWGGACASAAAAAGADPAAPPCPRPCPCCSSLQAPREGYSLFMSLGNDKLPTFAGLGHVSMYMCQFPFDLGSPTRPGTVKALASYDYVLLNSEFTDRWVSGECGWRVVCAGGLCLGRGLASWPALESTLQQRGRQFLCLISPLPSLRHAPHSHWPCTPPAPCPAPPPAAAGGTTSL